MYKFLTFISLLILPLGAWAQQLEEGEYLIQETATGKYLGGANSWDTQASLIDHAITFKLKSSGNGSYEMDSHTYNSQTSHFFNGSYVDGASTPIYLIPQDNTTYKMCLDPTTDTWTKVDGSTVVSNGTVDEAALFNIIPYNSALEHLATATEQNPLDATFIIKAPNFSRNHYHKNYENVWISGGTIGGENTNMNMEFWKSSFDTYQTLTGLPNGIYTLKAQAAYHCYDSVVEPLPSIYANGETLPFIIIDDYVTEFNQNVMSQRFTNGMYATTPISVKVTEGTLKVGATYSSNNCWCCWDNFVLTYYGPEIDPPEPPVVTTKLTVGETGYATYYSDKSWTVLTENSFNVFVVSDVSGQDMTLVNIGQDIPAETGVIIKATPGEYTLAVNSEVIPPSKSLLGGTLSNDPQQSGYIYYTLNVTESGPVFKKYNSSLNLQANKAFYSVGGSAAE